MRLRSRPTVKETLTRNPEDDIPPGVELPRKAQSLLGTKVQVNVSNSRDYKRDDFAQLRKTEQKNLGQRFTSQKAPQIPLPSGISDMPSWSTAEASNRSSSDILPTPTTASPGQPANTSRNGSSTGVQTNQFYPNHQQSVESINREYYDPSKQPLNVSQQTSASAVRDMALRKGSPKVHEMASDQIASNSKHSAHGGDASKKPRKLDLSSLFPRPGASGSRLLSPAKYANSPSAMTETTDFFPQETVHAEVRRQGPNGRFETHKSPKPPSSEAATTPRVKIFEPDIYDVAKTHTRKPPKGIKNWFDGFDISSDEEENEPVELPANPPRPSVEAIPSDFSPYSVATSGRAVPSGSHTPHHTEDNLHPIDPAKAITRRRMQSRSSESSTVTDSSGGAGGHKRSGESRLAHSRLDSQSVLSLSSESEEEREILSPIRDSRYDVEDESTLGTNLPSPVIRKVDNQQGIIQGLGVRTGDSTAPTTGTNPNRLRDSTAAPIVVEDWVSSEYSEDKNPPLQPQPSPAITGGARDGRSKTTASSVQVRAGLKSAGGETSSSVPSDASHVMAVTEEEMMLLELMRNKRAMMQKNSFREGYRLALKQEQDFLSKRRQSAHNSVSKMLEERANREGRFSPTSNPSELEADNVERKQQLPSNRYSVFRRQDVDKGFKIDRFLAMEGSHDEPSDEQRAELEDETDDDPHDEPREERYVAKMARMERFLMMKPSLADAIYDGRPVSGTEIETDTMTATEDEYAPSPMQRLAGMGREELRVSSPLTEDEDDEKPEDSDFGYDEHHERVRAFLQSTHTSEDPSITALPQMSSDEQGDRREKQTALLSPSIHEEDMKTPKVAERSPLRSPANFGSQTNTPRPPVDGFDQSTLLPVSKFQDRSRLAPATDSAPTELPSPRRRPSSISTGLTSPLSQSFSTSPPDKSTAEASTSRSPSYMSSPHLASKVKRISRVPTRIDTGAGKTLGRITSMSSMTSAGEDVLAAWAELGGGTDALAARRRGR